MLVARITWCFGCLGIGGTWANGEVEMQEQGGRVNTQSSSYTLRVVSGSMTGRKALSCCSCGRAAKSGHTSSFLGGGGAVLDVTKKKRGQAKGTWLDPIHPTQPNDTNTLSTTFSPSSSPSPSQPPPLPPPPSSPRFFFFLAAAAAAAAAMASCSSSSSWASASMSSWPARKTRMSPGSGSDSWICD